MNENPRSVMRGQVITPYQQQSGHRVSVAQSAGENLLQEERLDHNSRCPFNNAIRGRSTKCDRAVRNPFIVHPGSLLNKIQSFAIDDMGQREEDAAFTFFPRLLTVESKEQNTNHVVQQITWAISVYNDGLTLHHAGLRTCSSQDRKLLSEALQRYELSFTIVEKVRSFVPIDDLLVLLLALFNNMGHIYEKLYDPYSAQHCADWLQSAMTSSATDALDFDDYCFFYVNISVISLKPLCVAPAA